MVDLGQKGEHLVRLFILQKMPTKKLALIIL